MLDFIEGKGGEGWTLKIGERNGAEWKTVFENDTLF
jgi:hypothetical protein